MNKYTKNSEIGEIVECHGFVLEVCHWDGSDGSSSNCTHCRLNNESNALCRTIPCLNEERTDNRYINLKEI